MIELVSLLEKEERSELACSAMWGDSEKTALCKPGGEPAPEPNHADTLTSGFPTSRTGRNKFCLSSSISGILSGSLTRLKLEASLYRISRRDVKTEERARKTWGAQAGVYCTDQARDNTSVGLSLGSGSGRNLLMQTDIFNSSTWGSSEYKSVTPFSGFLTAYFFLGAHKLWVCRAHPLPLSTVVLAGAFVLQPNVCCCSQKWRFLVPQWQIIPGRKTNLIRSLELMWIVTFCFRCNLSPILCDFLTVATSHLSPKFLQWTGLNMFHFCNFRQNTNWKWCGHV